MQREIDLKYRYDNYFNDIAFFEYQEVIKKDLQSIRYLILDSKDSKAKEKLLNYIDKAITDILRNQFDPCNIFMYLQIRVYDNYLAFSFWKINDDGKFELDAPSIVVITRDMKKIYFADVTKILKYDEFSDYDNIGIIQIDSFIRKKDNIKNNMFTFKMRLGDLYYDLFYDTNSFIKKLN